MTNEQRLREAERIAQSIKGRLNSAVETKPCADCKWLFGPEPGYKMFGRGDFCRNPVLRESKFSRPGDGSDRAIAAGYARSGDGLCGPDALFWQAAFGRALIDLLARLFGAHRPVARGETGGEG